MSFLYLTLSTSTFHPFKTHALTNKNTSRLPRKQLSLSPAYPLNLNPLFKPKTPNSSPLTPRAHLTFSLVSPADQWGTWAVLSANGALGIWSEKTEMGSVLEWRGGEHSDGPFGKQFGDYSLRGSGFRADLRSIVRSSRALLLALLLGSVVAVATAFGTVVAYKLVPMRMLGQDSWKIAAALMSSYIGGTVNLVAVAEALGISPSVLAAGIAADNVVCAVYFTSLFALASKIPPEALNSTDDNVMENESKVKQGLPVLQTATALAVSFFVCKIATFLTKILKTQGGSLPCITTIVVILATLFPTQLDKLAPAGEAIAFIIMQVLFKADALFPPLYPGWQNNIQLEALPWCTNLNWKLPATPSTSGTPTAVHLDTP